MLTCTPTPGWFNANESDGTRDGPCLVRQVVRPDFVDIPDAFIGLHFGEVEISLKFKFV